VPTAAVIDEMMHPSLVGRLRCPGALRLGLEASPQHSEREAKPVSLSSGGVVGSYCPGSECASARGDRTFLGLVLVCEPGSNGRSVFQPPSLGAAASSYGEISLDRSHHRRWAAHPNGVPPARLVHREAPCDRR